MSFETGSMQNKVKIINMRKFLVPTSEYGKKTLWLILLFWVFIVIFRIVILMGYRGGDTFFSQPALFIPISLAGLCAVAAFFVGFISMIKDRDRSLFVILTTAFGGFVLYFILGELLYPH